MQALTCRNIQNDDYLQLSSIVTIGGLGTGTLKVDNIYPMQTNGNLNLYPNGMGTVYVQNNGLMIANSSLTSYLPSTLNAYDYRTFNLQLLAQLELKEYVQLHFQSFRQHQQH